MFQAYVCLLTTLLFYCSASILSSLNVHAKDLEERYLATFIMFFWNSVPSLRSAKYAIKIGTSIIMLHIIFWLFLQCKYLGLVMCFELKLEEYSWCHPLKKTTSYHSMHCSEAGPEAPMSVSSDVTLRVGDLHL